MDQSYLPEVPWLRTARSFRLIVLFAGAGGMTLGFSPAFDQPFVPVWASDFNKYAVETYNTNFGSHCVEGDIVEVLKDPNIVIPDADVVIGGPPCQGFSLLNKERNGDPRRQLWRPFLEVVQRSGASIFVMENVVELLGSPEHEAIALAAEQLGFTTTAAKLSAADYGVPQRRRRAFIIGCRFADPSTVFPPPRTHYDPSVPAPPRSPTYPSSDEPHQLALFEPRPRYAPNARPWVTVREAIGELDPPVGTQIRKDPPPYDLHFGRNPTQVSLARYHAIPDEGMNRFDLQRIAPELTPQCWINKKSGGTDLFGRLWWDRPAFTIRTEFFKPEKGRYLHPQQHRPITHREAARLQSFPDNFGFCGTKIEIAKQIGNAVPPLLASHVARCVVTLLIGQAEAPYAGQIPA
jgi:DNA (cytosine-5)-methyltransferase 1